MAMLHGSQINPALGRIDYTPYTIGSMEGSRQLGRGIANAAGGLAAGMRERGQSREERKRMSKILEGMDPDRYDSDTLAEMGTGDMKGVIESFLQQETQKRNQMQMQAAQAQLQQQQQQQAALSNLGQTLQMFSQGGGPPLTVDNQRRASAAGQMPGAPAAAALMQAQGGVATPDVLKQFLAQPDPERAGFTPEQMGVAQPVQGVPGTHFVPTSRGGGQIVQPPAARDERDTRSQFERDVELSVRDGIMTQEEADNLRKARLERQAEGNPMQLPAGLQIFQGMQEQTGQKALTDAAANLERELSKIRAGDEGRQGVPFFRTTAGERARKAWVKVNEERARQGMEALPLPRELATDKPGQTDTPAPYSPPPGDDRDLESFLMDY